MGAFDVDPKMTAAALGFLDFSPEILELASHFLIYTKMK
jgi:hypothetical protein